MIRLTQRLGVQFEGMTTLRSPQEALASHFALR